MKNQWKVKIDDKCLHGGMTKSVYANGGQEMVVSCAACGVVLDIVPCDADGIPTRAAETKSGAFWSGDK